jgi:membrane protease YdiL (CAAX protease family)
MHNFFNSIDKIKFFFLWVCTVALCLIVPLVFVILPQYLGQCPNIDWYVMAKQTGGMLLISPLLTLAALLASEKVKTSYARVSKRKWLFILIGILVFLMGSLVYQSYYCS